MGPPPTHDITEMLLRARHHPGGHPFHPAAGVERGPVPHGAALCTLFMFMDKGQEWGKDITMGSQFHVAVCIFYQPAMRRIM